MSIGSSIRRSTAWLMAGSTSTQILNFMFGIILARLLMPEDFGMLVTINIFTGLAGFFAGGGMGQALVQAKHVEKKDFDIVFTLQLIIGIFIFAFFYFASPWFANWYQNPTYADLLCVSALNFLLRPFVSVPSSILSRNMQFRELTIINVFTLLVTNAVSIGMAFMGFDVWSLILGGLFGSCAKAMALWPSAHWKPGLSIEFSRGKEMARYGMMTTLTDFIVHVRRQATNFILSKTLGPQTLGLFNKADSLALIPQAQITGSVYQVTFRVLSKEQDNLSSSIYVYLRSITLVSLYTWPILLALGWLAQPLIHFVYGEKWVDAAPALSVLAAVGPFIMLEILAGSVLAARNWLDKEIPIQIAQLIVVCLGVVAGLPFGLLGVAIGASMANVYGAIHMSWLAAKSLGMPTRPIFYAMTTPLFMNLTVLVLWISIDQFHGPHPYSSDFYHLAVTLLPGLIIYLMIFFFAPLSSLTQEKKRWIEQIRKVRQLI